jgi:hypothetical protein
MNDDAYEHSYILAILSSLAPLHLYASRCTVASRFRCHLAVVGTLFEGFGRSVVSPPLTRRQRAMGRTVQPSSSLSDNRFSSFSGRSQGFKADLGNSAVRHCRGTSGDVAMAELRTRLATERVRVVALRLKQKSKRVRVLSQLSIPATQFC